MRSDGSPQAWPGVLPTGGDTAKAGPWVAYREMTGYPSAFNDGSLAQLAALPTTADGLRAFFLAHQGGATNPRPGGTANEWVADAATYMLATEPVPPAVRAAAYELLAGLPGVRNAGPATDPLGRLGTAVVLPVRTLGFFATWYNQVASGTVFEVIIDPGSGQLLAVERVLARRGPAGLRKGAVVDWTAVKSAGWTDHAPKRAISPPG